MAIAYVGGGFTSGGAGNPFFSAIGGLAAGDLQLVMFAIVNTTDDVVRKAGWNMLINDYTSGAGGGSVQSRMAVFWRIHDGSTENPPSFTFYDGSAAYGALYIAYSGVNQSYPIGGYNYSINNVADVTIDIPSVKNRVADAMAVALYFMRGSAAGGQSFEHPDSYTERIDGVVGTNTRRSVGAADQIQPFGASVPGTLAQYTLSDLSIGAHVLLNPATAGFHVTDWRNPNAVAHASATTIGLGDGADWTGASNAAVSDDVRASMTGAGTGYDGDILKCTDYRFEMPPGSTVYGIEVEFEGRAYFTGNHGGGTKFMQLTAGLYRAGTAESFFKINNMKLAAIYVASPNATTPADETVRVGGLGDVWQGEWTNADVENSGFGCLILPQLSLGEGPDAGAGNCVVQADLVRMRLHFRPPINYDAII